MINWKIRFKNKLFWMSMIPAVLLLAQQVAGLFGLTIDLTDKQNELLSIAETVFLILTLLGIVADPTTEGVGDSERAKNYTELGGGSNG